MGVHSIEYKHWHTVRSRSQDCVLSTLPHRRPQHQRYFAAAAATCLPMHHPAVLVPFPAQLPLCSFLSMHSSQPDLQPEEEEEGEEGGESRGARASLRCLPGSISEGRCWAGMLPGFNTNAASRWAREAWAGSGSQGSSPLL